MNKKIYNNLFSNRSTLLFVLLFCFFLFFFSTSKKIHRYFINARSVVENFYNAKGDMMSLILSDPVKRVAYKAKQIIPEGSRVDMSPKAWVYTRCKARYVLYPLELNKDWDYFIDYENSIKDPPADWDYKNLTENIRIYAKPGFKFLDNSDYKDHQEYDPNPIIILTVLSISMIYVLTGIAIMSLLKIICKIGNKIWFLSSSYLIGFVILTLEAWGYLSLGGRFLNFDILAIWMATLVFLGFLSRSEFLVSLKLLLSSNNISSEDNKSLVEQFLTVTALMFLAVIFLLTVLTPVWSWDAMSHWIMKSKVVFFHKELAFHYTAQNYYPFLWPMHVADNFLFAGGVYDGLAKWSSALLFLSGTTQIFSGLKLMKLSNRWVLMIFNIFLLCFLSSNMMIAYAENAFYAFFSAVLVAILSYLTHEEKAKYATLTVIMTAGLSSSKIEGMVACWIISFVVLSLGKPMFFEKRKGVYAAGISVTSIIPIAWILRQYHEGYFARAYHVSNPVTLQKILHVVSIMYFSLMYEFGVKGLFFLTIYMIFLISRIFSKKDKIEVFLWRTSLLFVLFSFVAFFGWEYSEIDRQIMTLSRIFLHAVPVIILYIGYQVKLYAKNAHTL